MGTWDLDEYTEVMVDDDTKKAPPTVLVEAPSNLVPGYEFHVDAEKGVSHKVRVVCMRALFVALVGLDSSLLQLNALMTYYCLTRLPRHSHRLELRKVRLLLLSFWRPIRVVLLITDSTNKVEKGITFRTVAGVMTCAIV